MRSPQALRLSILAFAFCLWASPWAEAAQYVVSGLTLGDRLQFNSPDYQSYACAPSAEITGLTLCRRSRQRPGQRSTLTISESILHTQDGTALDLSAHVAPVFLNKGIVDREVSDLSRVFSAPPTIAEEPYRLRGIIVSVLAVWGDIKLKELDWQTVQKIAVGQPQAVGRLVDHLGDVNRSARDGLPVYRVTGGQGYVYSATFDKDGLGHRRYIAVDSSQLATKSFESALHPIVERDQSRANDDYSLWPEVAKLTRRLALDTSNATANAALDRAFAGFGTRKLHSRVWAILPGGVIEHLAAGTYSIVDTYGPNTKYAEIRRQIDAYLSTYPSSPFVEFLYYTIGEFEKGLQANPKSPIGNVLHYAAGHRNLELILLEAFSLFASKQRQDAYANRRVGVDAVLSMLNQEPELYEFKPLSTKLSTFARYAAVARRHFKVVVQNPSSPHADDAAYLLGWIASHEGNAKEALADFSQAMALGNADYKFTALKQVVRNLSPYPAAEQLAAVVSDKILSQESPLWYLTGRSSYRNFDYAQTIVSTEQGLKTLNVPLERLPATTDSKRIVGALERINPEWRDDRNLLELIYILHASRELVQFSNYLLRVEAEKPSDVYTRVKTTVVKYSMLLDEEEQRLRKLGTPTPAHRDLRQAAHLLDTTIAAIPKSRPYMRLREWLYYRRIQVLATYAPAKVAEAVADMERDVPTSQLLDDALAEQVRAEGLLLRDVNAAQRAFRKLIDTYPTGNAIDNAYTWMAIIYRCEERFADALELNQYIMRRFPLTRHAQYARERIADPRRQRISDSRLEACRPRSKG